MCEFCLQESLSSAASSVGGVGEYGDLEKTLVVYDENRPDVLPE